jgi:hypothetical protein
VPDHGKISTDPKAIEMRQIEMKRLLTSFFALTLITAACADSLEEPVDSGGGPSSTTGPTVVPVDASPFFVESTDILLMESFPVQVALRVNGSLPSPCHQAVWDVEDDGEAIHVTLATVAADEQICAQVLVPTELSIPLGTFESGARTVTLNGEEVGDFQI